MAKSSTSFKPGHPGGPGRPKNSLDFQAIVDSLPSSFRDELLTDLHGNKVTAKQFYAAGLLYAAGEGKLAALTEVGQRLLGKAPDKVEISGPDGGPIETEANELFARLLEAAARKVAEDAGGGEGEPT